MIVLFSTCSDVNPSELQMVLHRLDPAKTLEEVQLIMSKAFSISLERVNSLVEGEEQQELLSTPTSKVLKRLNKIGISRSGPMIS